MEKVYPSSEVYYSSVVGSLANELFFPCECISFSHIGEDKGYFLFVVCVDISIDPKVNIAVLEEGGKFRSDSSEWSGQVDSKLSRLGHVDRIQEGGGRKRWRWKGN